jgi:hypothetical protein
MQQLHAAVACSSCMQQLHAAVAAAAWQLVVHASVVQHVAQADEQHADRQ